MYIETSHRPPLSFRLISSGIVVGCGPEYLYLFADEELDYNVDPDDPLLTGDKIFSIEQKRQIEQDAKRAFGRSLLGEEPKL